MSADIIVARMRRFLLILAGIVYAMTPVELIFSKHTDSLEKLIPFALCAVGFVAVLVVQRQATRATLLSLRIVMVIIALGALFGGYEHWAGNVEYALETHAGAQLSDVLLNVLQGASPLLAPGILGLAAVLGIAATYAHPALAGAQDDERAGSKVMPLDVPRRG